MNKTLSQIITGFGAFATNHLEIAEFYASPIQKATSSNYLYPLMLTTVKSAVIENGQIRIEMDVFFFDLPSRDTEYIEKLSKTLVLAEDFITYFNKNEQTHGFYLIDGVISEPVYAAFEDGVVGWRVPAVIQVKSAENENILPI